MPVVIKQQRESVETVLDLEIERATAELRPISRRTLEHVLTQRLEIPAKEAAILVQEYCESKNLQTPDYLSDEFQTPYFKLTALFFVAVSIGVLFYGAKQFEAHRNYWPYFVGGAVLFCISGVGFLKVLRAEFAQK